MRAHRIPRWTFLRFTHERKPVYLDFDSPLCVDFMAHIARRGDPQAHVSFVEMLPTPRQCWLPDAQGNRYASEFRMVAVDSQTWRPQRP